MPISKVFDEYGQYHEEQASKETPENPVVHTVSVVSAVHVCEGLDLGEAHEGYHVEWKRHDDKQCHHDRHDPKGQVNSVEELYGRVVHENGTLEAVVRANRSPVKQLKCDIRKVDVGDENEQPHGLEKRVLSEHLGNILYVHLCEREASKEEQHEVGGRGVLQEEAGQATEAGHDAEVEGEVGVEDRQVLEGFVAGPPRQEEENSLEKQRESESERVGELLYNLVTVLLGYM